MHSLCAAFQCFRSCERNIFPLNCILAAYVRLVHADALMSLRTNHIQHEFRSRWECSSGHQREQKQTHYLFLCFFQTDFLRQYSSNCFDSNWDVFRGWKKKTVSKDGAKGFTRKWWGCRRRSTSSDLPFHVVAYFSSFRVPDVIRIRFELHCFRALFAGVRRTRPISNGLHNARETRSKRKYLFVWPRGFEIEVRARYVSIKTAT